MLLGLPNFRTFFQQENVAYSAQAWLNMIRATRYLAIKTRKPATLHWQTQRYIEQQNQLVHEIHSISPEITIEFHASFFRDDTLTFLPNGFTQGQQGHFSLCLRPTEQCQKIVVLSSGVVRLLR